MLSIMGEREPTEEYGNEIHCHGYTFAKFQENTAILRYIHFFKMRDEKEERSKQGQTNKAKQHSTPKAVTFPRKNELPQVGLEPTLYSRQSALPTELPRQLQLAGPKSHIS